MLDVDKSKILKIFEGEANRLETIPKHSGVIRIDFQRPDAHLEDSLAVAVTVRNRVLKIFVKSLSDFSQLYKLSCGNQVTVYRRLQVLRNGGVGI